MNQNTCVCGYYDFMLYDLASFGHHQVYLNTKNIRKKDNCKQKI